MKALVQGWADTNFYSLVPFEVEKLYVLGMGGYQGLTAPFLCRLLLKNCAHQATLQPLHSTEKEILNFVPCAYLQI